MKIKFKNIKEVDFNKVFPIIKEKDYILLSGQELIIQEDEYKKLLDNKYLNLGGFHISLHLIISFSILISSSSSYILPSRIFCHFCPVGFPK